MSDSFPYVFQTFGAAADRVLLAAAIVGLRNGDGLVKATQLIAFFDALRVPRPANIHRDLTALEGKKFLRRIGSLWSVTPVGKREVQEHLELFDSAELHAYLAGTPGSLLGNEKHVVIPAELAPTKWLPSIERLLQSFPFETNVFLMTRFPENSADTD